MNPRLIVVPAVCLLAMLLLSAGPMGCQVAAKPDVRSTGRSQYTTVRATPTAATRAATDALQSLRLKQIHTISTEVDGRVTAKTAQGTNVTVTIQSTVSKLMPEAVLSEVTVSIGMVGDRNLGVKVLSRIEDRLGEMDQDHPDG